MSETKNGAILMEISINLDDFGDCYLLNKLGLPQNGRGVLEIQENMDTWF
jgi:hypothetical protein